MKYALIFNENPSDFALRDHPEKGEAYFAPWMAYSKALHESGIYQAGAALQGPEVTTSVRVRNGKTQIQDGTFSETKEMLGGFIIIEVPDLDTALAWAARAPAATYGSVEVRPVQDCGSCAAAQAAAKGELVHA